MVGVRVLALPARANRAANPYNTLLSDALTELGAEVEEFSPEAARRGTHDILHVHWPEAHLNKPSWLKAGGRSAQRLLWMARARRRGARLVWTAHNLHAHEQRHPVLEHLFWWCFIRLLDGWIALSATGAGAAQARFPRLGHLPSRVVPHGHYREAYPPALPRPEARAALGLPDTTTVGFIGRVKPYKQLPSLIAAFAGLGRPDVQLVVAGKATEEEARSEVESAAAGVPSVTLHLQDLPEEDMPRWLGAMDLVVTPYREVLNSGTALLALSFGRPILVPAIGAMTELAEAAPEWVLTYEPPLGPADLERALVRAEALRQRPASPLGDLDWPRLAETTLALYDEVLASPRGRP